MKLKDDIMFKAFFSRNQDCLENFLSVILEEKIKIKEVIHDFRLEQLAKEEKYGILDLNIELSNGENVALEMQLNDNKNIEKRTTFYASKMISKQIEVGEDYKLMKRVIVIAILNYSMNNLPEYITETVRVSKEHREYEINNVVKYIYIELEKFRKQARSMKDIKNQWLAVLDMENEKWVSEAMKENVEIRDAIGKYVLLQGDEAIKRLEEIKLKSRLEEKSALGVAREEGIKEGEIKSKEQIIKKLLKMKMPIEQIAEITELSVEEIEKIAKKECLE